MKEWTIKLKHPVNFNKKKKINKKKNNLKSSFLNNQKILQNKRNYKQLKGKYKKNKKNADYYKIENIILIKWIKKDIKIKKRYNKRLILQKILLHLQQVE